MALSLIRLSFINISVNTIKPLGYTCFARLLSQSNAGVDVRFREPFNHHLKSSKLSSIVLNLIV